MLKKLPVYDLHAFQNNQEKNDFYCNYLNLHVREHQFTNLPHKHDFYLVIVVTEGSGWHEVDFVPYPVKPGSVFLLQPGQMHYWKLSNTINGYVFFHTKAFYDEGYTKAGIRDFPFFKSFQCEPGLNISKIKIEKLKNWMEEIIVEYKAHEKQKLQKIHALINLVYIEVARDYLKHAVTKKQIYLVKLHEFENLIELHFKQIKLPHDYASKLNISEKHLNRITKECLNKTSTELIADRIILEAKRMLIHAELNVTQIGYELGYMDNSYFVRLFKKQTGETPLAFFKRYDQ